MFFLNQSILIIWSVLITRIILIARKEAQQGGKK